jgi:hypothetical protein
MFSTASFVVMGGLALCELLYSMSKEVDFESEARTHFSNLKERLLRGSDEFFVFITLSVSNPRVRISQSSKSKTFLST